MDFIAGVRNNIWTILFYSAILLLLYLNRKRFKFQGIVAIYRTKIGIKAMDRWGRKFAGPLKILGYIGVVLGFIVMALMAGLLVYSVHQFLTVKDAPPALAPVLPGVSIPGSPISLPLISGFLGLFIVVVVHEFAHGLLCRAHKIPVKNTGYMQLLFIPGAFVEPDEKKLSKAPKRVQQSIFAAGAFSNMLFAFITILVLIAFSFGANLAIKASFDADGFTFERIDPGSPAEKAGLDPSLTYTTLNGAPINTREDLGFALSKVQPGSMVTLGDGSASFSIATAAHPSNASRSYVGILDIKTHYSPKSADVPAFVTPALFGTLGWLLEVLNVIIFLNIAIGMVNLLPLGPVDGGRMFLLGMQSLFGEKTGTKIWGFVSFFLLGVIAILLFQFFLSVGKALF